MEPTITNLKVINMGPTTLVDSVDSTDPIPSAQRVNRPDPKNRIFRPLVRKGDNNSPGVLNDGLLVLIIITNRNQ